MPSIMGGTTFCLAFGAFVLWASLQMSNSASILDKQYDLSTPILLCFLFLYILQTVLWWKIVAQNVPLELGLIS